MKTKLAKNVCKAAALCIAAGTMLVGNGIVANAQPKEMKDGTVFDAEYYAQTYADVVAVYGIDENALYQHYCDYGKAENRAAVAPAAASDFDPVYYAAQNPDVVAVYGNEANNLYQHYLQYGKNEGRKPAAAATGGTETTAPAATASVQTTSISDEAALEIFKNYLNNLVANTPDSVCAFFDTDGNYIIADEEMNALIAWTFDNYNMGDKSVLDEEEWIAIGRALYDGTFKRPDTLYYV